MAKYLADIHNITSDETLHYKTPHFVRKGAIPDISAFLQFTFYEPVYYFDPEEKFPHTKENRGHWIGVAHHVGDHLCFEILTEKHTVVERSVVRSAHTHINKAIPHKMDPIVKQEPSNGHTDDTSVITFSDKRFKRSKLKRHVKFKDTDPIVTNTFDTLPQADDMDPPTPTDTTLIADCVDIPALPDDIQYDSSRTRHVTT